jgi:hypothetical protein
MPVEGFAWIGSFNESARSAGDEEMAKTVEPGAL